MTDINLEYYKVFYITANEKSMTKAAEVLCITQPAVSASIKRLEEQVGFSLFNRSNKGLTLTPSGEIFYNKVKMAMNLFEEIEKSTSSQINLEKGKLTVGVSAVLTKVFLMDYIKEYRKAHPGIEIEIRNGLTPELLKELENGKIDAVIYNDGENIPSSLWIQEIAEKEYIFASNNGEIQNLIVQKRGSFTREFMENLLKKSVPSNFSVVSQDLACSFAEEGLGMCFAFKSLVKKYHPLLQEVKSMPSAKTKIYLALNTWTKDIPATKEFQKILLTK